MPCYDKKLEASRSDFYDDIFKTRDVDSVLATTEIIDLLRQENVDFPSLEESPIDKL
jgi:iron only hydrogenase large subunit-like protein